MPSYQKKFHRVAHTIGVSGTNGLTESRCCICGKFIAASTYIVVVETAEAIHKCEDR